MSNAIKVPLALPPAPRNPSYEHGLRAAMEGLVAAIKAKACERNCDFRFQDIQRISRIGEAIERQIARARMEAGGYIRDNPIQGRAGGARFRRGFGGDNLGNLGGVNFDIDGLNFEEGGDAQNGAYGAGACYANPPGVGVVQPAIRDIDPGNPLAAMTEAVGGLAENRKLELAESRKLDVLRELEQVRDALADEKIADDERTVLTARRTLLLKEIEQMNVRDQVALDAAAVTRERTKRFRERIAQDPPPMVRCVACGNAHDGDWVDELGAPLRCDVCNEPMVAHPAPARAVCAP